MLAEEVEAGVVLDEDDAEPPLPDELDDDVEEVEEEVDDEEESDDVDVEELSDLAAGLSATAGFDEEPLRESVR
ncbi:hypothetical protein [Spirilliplanes yamanashiensis]|uniref:Uncharacterized protein n=1 Tax=Spirilliplanes yamanashiensis TaxID=42233 RepID=A0A8J4DFL8_9ACTN|nr:hypothetical protein [Spirilliplanes yamanashiensis]MDP9814255.1 hypothetical protein [Spirilliplanes yamanashiensis]GIJ00762.1 hypothetical protein Sya03_01140 [Spirilliplanes yamanashiensis]